MTLSGWVTGWFPLWTRILLNYFRKHQEGAGVSDPLQYLHFDDCGAFSTGTIKAVTSWSGHWRHQAGVESVFEQTSSMKLVHTYSTYWVIDEVITLHNNLYAETWQYSTDANTDTVFHTKSSFTNLKEPPCSLFIPILSISNTLTYKYCCLPSG